MKEKGKANEGTFVMVVVKIGREKKGTMGVEVP